MKDLTAGDVRLTMGGEPTFVSIDDADGAEWTTSAFGPNKRRLSVDLILKLRDRFAPGALLHFGQGKWYPGEPLPRWALGCYWRKDGVPIWRDQALFANDDEDYKYNAADARRFLEALTRRLEVDPQFIMTAYEDVLYYLWKERQAARPTSIRTDSKLEGSDRARAAGPRLRRGSGQDHRLRASAAADSRPHQATPYWTSQPWFLALGAALSGARRFAHGISLAARIAALDQARRHGVEFRPRSFQGTRQTSRHAGPQAAPFHAEGLQGRTAAPAASIANASRSRRRKANRRHGSRARRICVQVREGKLFIFMPPVEYLADYLDLIAAIEDTAAHLAMKIVIEGYTPPYDPRISVLKVTPDPGVIEVNIHPASSWDELVENTTELYALARESRLGTEKFMLDGRHSGTGGGNHVVIGAALPEDSAFLRRPDLLRSMVGFWQNHPSLSYLFSGLFIGPTSQHPRVDEARMDSLYELEIAFSQVPDKGEENITPWLVDRIFRNLLIDLTGNTHRTELCIDKLYPPDSASSRLGLVELRAFEMPPHARMSLTQQLLVRALIAHFWESPYKRPLIFWGTALHDRFMLPYFIERDWEDVLEELNEAGYPFQKEWFAPHFEFRFPAIGSITKRGIHLELRHALEPWNVLGEETSAGGTARNVDSSVERMQVKVSGMIDPRFTVLCNGRPVPLHPTGVTGRICGRRAIPRVAAAFLPAPQHPGSYAVGV